MSTFKIRTDKGLIDANGFKFKHYIGNYQHSFGYEDYTRKVTHLDSGLSLGTVRTDLICAFLGDKKATAKDFLDRLVEIHTADKINTKLKEATKQYKETSL